MNRNIHEFSPRKKVAAAVAAGTLALSGCGTKNKTPDTPGPAPATTCMPQARGIGTILLEAPQWQALAQGRQPDGINFDAFTAGTPYKQADIVSFRIVQRVGTPTRDQDVQIATGLDTLINPDSHQDSLILLAPSGIQPGEIRVQAGVDAGCRTITLPPSAQQA